MPGTREDWFPTSIWFFDLPDAASMNERLLPEILAEREADPEGMTERSSVLGWHSRDEMHRRESFAPLMEHVRAGVAEVAAFNNWDLSKVDPRVINCWAIVNDKYSSNTVHNHPQSILSGVYYIQAVEKSGDLFFRDPREGPGMTAPPVVEHTPWTFQRVVYKPTAGRLLIFPSWLLHGVEPNMTDSQRVCVSFNVGIFWK